jgi:hypothetical protein
MEMIDMLLESRFMMMGKAYRHDDPRVIYIRPDAEPYPVLVEQLRVWEREGVLSFIEEAR